MVRGQFSLGILTRRKAPKRYAANLLKRLVLLEKALISFTGFTTHTSETLAFLWNVLVFSSWLHLIYVYICSTCLLTFNKVTYALNSQEKPEWKNWKQRNCLIFLLSSFTLQGVNRDLTRSSTNMSFLVFVAYSYLLCVSEVFWHDIKSV